MSASLASFAGLVQSLIVDSGYTAYTYETLDRAANTVPAIDLTAPTPSVYTDCSGWVNYALDSVAPIHQAVAAAEREDPRFNLGTVMAYNNCPVTIDEAAQPWARADVLSYFFGNVADGADGFTTVSDFSTLEAGDLIAYATGIYTDPTAANAAADPRLQRTSDTGHTMIVMGNPVAVPEGDWQGSGLSSDVVAVYAVPVIDSSVVPHFGNLADFSQPLADSRRYDSVEPDPPNLPAFISTNDLTPGGLGTGTIWFGVNAEGQAIQFRFGERDPWFPNNTTGQSAEAAISISAARLTDNIDLSGSMLNAQGQLVVDLFTNAAPVLNDIVQNTQTEHLTGSGGLLLEGGGYLQLQAGNSFSGGVTLAGATLDLASADAAGTGAITFAEGTDSTVTMTRAAVPANSFLGFAAGDRIDISDLPYDPAAQLVYNDGTLTIDAGGEGVRLRLALADPAQGPQVVADGLAGTEVILPCFAAGTWIETAAGPVPVEAIRPGDLVRRIEGDLAPVIWVGARRVDCRRHARPEAVWPVRVAAHALGLGRPGRDLWLSPDHAIFFAGVLIPVKHLVDGAAVMQCPMPHITYVHLELAEHAVLLAEGLPAESYLDTGDRAAFAAPDAGVLALHPSWGERGQGDAAFIMEALGYAPLRVTGPEVEAARRLLAVRAVSARSGRACPAARRAPRPRA